MSNLLKGAALALLLALGACTTKVESAKRVSAPATAPPALAFVWSASKPPSFGHLPALGAAIPGTPASAYTDNYAAQFAEFGAALESRLKAEPALKLPQTTVLPLTHTPAQLAAALRAAGPAVPVVEMHPERVTSYCAPGCYAFKVRVNVQSAAPRKLLWTALIDLPPKARHSDPFGPLAADFVDVLVRQLRAEGLLPSA